MSSPRVQSARPRIDAALDALTDGGLALICGSAGYGKSSAVAAWGIRADRPMRWLRASRGLDDALHLTADEDDGVRLPRLARAVRQQQLATVCAAALLADLSAPHSELIFVVDDADALAKSPDGLAFLRALAERAPDRSRVALIGRRVAELRLIAARAKREVMQIGASALRVSPGQTRQIAEARGWSGAPTALEEARRAAAGNGGILATWLDQIRKGGDRTELEEFIRRDVVGSSEPLLAR
ncbi:MAG: hypothetical protein ACKOFY_06040, partial [Candidatus Limnocylindrus sp.]